MDIAKIRKKAKEKERETAGGPLPQPREEEGRDKDAADAGESAFSGAPAGAQPVPEPAADTSEDPASSPAVMGQEEAASEKEDGSTHGEIEGQEQIVELLTFSLSTEEFAFRLSEVEEIIRHQRITPVPAMPGYVLGITSLRGKIIPVIDLRRRIVLRNAGGHSETPGGSEQANNAKVLILLGPKGPIGATIDRVNGVVRFPESKILAPPVHLLEEERRFVGGVVVMERRFVSIVRSEEALNIEVT
jgi:purine-binding chemotaxis protein CheW